MKESSKTKTGIAKKKQQQQHKTKQEYSKVFQQFLMPKFKSEDMIGSCL